MDPIPLPANDPGVFLVCSEDCASISGRRSLHELLPVQFYAAQVFAAHEDVNVGRLEGILPRVYDEPECPLFSNGRDEVLPSVIMYQKRYMVK